MFLPRFGPYSAYSGILGHVRTYSGIIIYIQGLFRHIQAYQKPCIILAYSTLSYIQNLRHIQNPGIFRFLNYPEERHIQRPGIFRVLNNPYEFGDGVAEKRAIAEGSEFWYTVINQFIVKKMDNFHFIQIDSLYTYILLFWKVGVVTLKFYLAWQRSTLCKVKSDLYWLI